MESSLQITLSAITGMSASDTGNTIGEISPEGEESPSLFINDVIKILGLNGISADNISDLFGINSESDSSTENKPATEGENVSNADIHTFLQNIIMHGIENVADIKNAVDVTNVADIKNAVDVTNVVDIKNAVDVTNVVDIKSAVELVSKLQHGDLSGVSEYIDEMGEDITVRTEVLDLDTKDIALHMDQDVLLTIDDTEKQDVLYNTPLLNETQDDTLSDGTMHTSIEETYLSDGTMHTSIDETYQDITVIEENITPELNSKYPDAAIADMDIADMDIADTDMVEIDYVTSDEDIDTTFLELKNINERSVEKNNADITSKLHSRVYTVADLVTGKSEITNDTVEVPQQYDMLGDNVLLRKEQQFMWKANTTSSGSVLDLRWQTWRSNLAENIAELVSVAPKRIQMSLYPKNLGMITVDVAIADSGGLRLRFQSRNDKVRKILSAEGGALTAALSAKGITLSRVEVHRVDYDDKIGNKQSSSRVKENIDIMREA